MDVIIQGVGMVFRAIFTGKLSRYHLTGLFLLLLMRRNIDADPAEYMREFYYKLRFAPMPTKLLTWPIRLALCFLLALPNVSDFPLGLTICDQYIFPFLLLMEIVSFSMLGIHVSDYCTKNPVLCYFSRDENQDAADLCSCLFCGVFQFLITTHLIYILWLIKSMRHVLVFLSREGYMLATRLMPILLPLARVILLTFAFNLQNNVFLIMFVYMTCKIIMDRFITPRDRPYDTTVATINAIEDGSGDTEGELEDVDTELIDD